MKDTDAATLVDQIRQRIATSVGDQRFRLWFHDSTKMTVGPKTLEVGVPNLFFQEWLHTNFSDVIQRAALEVTGLDLDVRFRVDGELFRHLREKQASPDPQQPIMTSALPGNRRPAPVDERRRRLSLDDFVVGPCNRIAFAAAQQVIESPGTKFNPLFVHGSVGLGKTHLLQGIYRGMRKAQPELQGRYLSAEQFTNDYIQSMRTNDLPSFRKRLRSVDVLVIDDIHFLANKMATQEEFLHTFNALEAESRQVVMASDSHPKMIAKLSDSLVNRFVAGMVCRLEPPEYATRVEILRMKAAKMRRQFPDEVLDYIAENLRGNVRELEGALNCLGAYASLVKGRVDVDMAREALAEIMQHAVRAIQLKDIERVVCALFGLEARDLKSRKRVRTISYPRMIGMYLARKHTQACYADIGKFFGHKNHTTVISAERTVARWLAGNLSQKIGDRQWPIRRLVAMLEKDLRISA